MQRVTDAAFEMAANHAVVVLGVANGRFDRLPTVDRWRAPPVADANRSSNRVATKRNPSFVPSFIPPKTHGNHDKIVHGL